MEILEIGYTLHINVFDLMQPGIINHGLIRNSRVRHNLSLADLSDMIGKDISTISKYECGTFIPKGWYTLKQLCLVLNLSADEVLDIINHPCSRDINTDLINKHREHSKLTIRKLSELLGKPTQSAFRYIDNKYIPASWITLKKLCYTLKISSDDLLGIKVETRRVKNEAFFSAMKTYLK